MENVIANSKRIENVYVPERIELDAEKLKQILEIGTAAFPEIVERPIELKLPIEYSSNGLSSECNNFTCSVNVTLLLLSAKHS
jgi:hypothetical protein